MFVPPINNSLSTNGNNSNEEGPINANWNHHTVEIPTNLPTSKIVTSYQSCQKKFGEEMEKFKDAKLIKSFSDTPSSTCVHQIEAAVKDFFEDENSEFEFDNAVKQEEYAIKKEDQTVKKEDQTVKKEKEGIEQKQVGTEEKQVGTEEKQVAQAQTQVVKAKINTNLSLYSTVFDKILKSLGIKAVDPYFAHKEFTKEVGSDLSLLSESQLLEVNKRILKRGIQAGVFTKNGRPLLPEEGQEILKRFDFIFKEYYQSEIRPFLKETQAKEDKKSDQNNEHDRSLFSVFQETYQIQQPDKSKAVGVSIVDKTSEAKIDKIAIERLAEVAILAKHAEENLQEQEEFNYFRLKHKIIWKNIQQSENLEENKYNQDLKIDKLSRDILREPFKSPRIFLTNRDQINDNTRALR